MIILTILRYQQPHPANPTYLVCTMHTHDIMRVWMRGNSANRLWTLCYCFYIQHLHCAYTGAIITCRGSACMCRHHLINSIRMPQLTRGSVAKTYWIELRIYYFVPTPQTSQHDPLFLHSISTQHCMQFKEVEHVNGATSPDALWLVMCPLDSITSRVQMAPGQWSLQWRYSDR